MGFQGANARFRIQDSRFIIHNSYFIISLHGRHTKRSVSSLGRYLGIVALLAPDGASGQQFIPDYLYLNRFLFAIVLYIFFSMI